MESKRSVVGSVGIGRSMVVAAALVAVVVATGTAYAIRDSQSKGHRAMEERLATRAEMGTRFVEAYAEDVLARESFQALTNLVAEPPPHEQFVEAVSDLGFQAGVLLDDRGRLLDVHPSKPELLGTRMTEQYEHLALAVAGEPTVSNVIGSAARNEPIVAFAVPYQAVDGRRVFSAGFSIAGTPLVAFLRTALPFRDHSLYLVDGKGQIVASSDAESDRGPIAGSTRCSPTPPRGRAKASTSVMVTGSSW